jgi:signal transduction histidine kinase
MDVSDNIAITHNGSANHQLECRMWEMGLETVGGASQLVAPRFIEGVFEAMADAVVVYDQKGNILQANAAFRELLAVDIQPDYISGVLHDRMSRVAMRDEMGQLLTEEQWPMTRILHGDLLNGANALDVTITALDGRVVEVNAGGAPVRDQQGRIVGAVVIYRDVTERRRLDRRTHEALDALLAMAEALVQVPVGFSAENTSTSIQQVAQRLVELIRSVLGCERVSITTVDTETQVWHSLAVVGLRDDLAKRWYARRPGFHLSELFADSSIDERLRANEVIMLDLRQAARSAYPNPFGISTMLLAPMMVDKQFVGVLTLDHAGADHTFTQEEKALAGAVAKLAGLVIERERLVQGRTEAQARSLALQEANRRMDAFLGIASHELRTPLTVVRGNVQLAKRFLEGSTQPETNLAEMHTHVQELLDRVERQVEIQDRLVSDLLDVSRIQENKLYLHLHRCDLVTIVREAVQDIRYLAQQRTITFSLEKFGISHEGSSTGDYEVVPVIADEDRISQVVTNYLTNALKYSPADQPVEVFLEVIDSHEGIDRAPARLCPYARVSVRDYGPGIPIAEQDRIWERFYRFKDVEVQGGSGVGLGLGLHICRTILEQHRGQFGVQSTPGEGSTFWFTLALAP